MPVGNALGVQVQDDGLARDDRQVQDDSPAFVIPDLIRNPQNGKPKWYFEPWILNQVQDDRLVRDDRQVQDDR